MCSRIYKPAKRWSPEAQGQRASWAKHLSWTYGILGKELVDEGRSRLRRFRQYVRKPGSWMMPSWKEVIKWVKMFKSLMISDAVELVVDGWSTAATKKTTGTCLGVKNLGKVWWFQPTSPWIVRGLARGNHSKWFCFRGWGFSQILPRMMTQSLLEWFKGCDKFSHNLLNYPDRILTCN